MPQGSAAGYNILWVDGSPCVFLGDYPQWYSFPWYKLSRETNLTMGCLRADGFIKVSPKILSFNLFRKIGLELLGIFSKTFKDLAIKEKSGIQFWQGPISPRKFCGWHLVLGFGKPRALCCLSRSRSSPCSNIRCPRDQICFWPKCNLFSTFCPFKTKNFVKCILSSCEEDFSCENESKEPNSLYITTNYKNEGNL